MSGQTTVRRISELAIKARERKKATQRAMFLRVALDLFARQGFDRVRMDDVAVGAGVSVATLYNYFKNKRQLLVAVLVQDRLDGIDAYESAIRAPHPDPSIGVANLLYANIAIIKTASDKRLWRELLGAVATSHDREHDGFARDEDTFKAFITRLLKHYASTSALPSDMPVTLATDIIFGLNEQNLRHLVACAICRPEHLRDVARQQLAMLFGQSRNRPHEPLQHACRCGVEPPSVSPTPTRVEDVSDVQDAT
jgi:AcrR family transcriptional regulator